MNTIQELFGYGYVTECLELKNCDMLKRRNTPLTAPEDSSLLGCYILFTVNNLPVI